MAQLPPHYRQFTLYGPFWRQESTTQTADDVHAQLESGEIWGTPSRYSGDTPVIQGRRELTAGERGIQFLAYLPPHKRYFKIPEWRVPQQGPDGPLLWIDHHPTLGVVAKLKVAIIRVTQEF